MQKKSNSIVLWRIIATYMIAFVHFDNCYYIFEDLGLRMGWHVMVDFFFIVSGYLLFTNFDKLQATCKNGLDYFLLRYKKIYPLYLGGFLLCFILYVKVYGERPIDVLVTHVFELFCMQGIGLNLGWVFVNNSMWYMSVMLIAGFIIFHCLTKWKDTFVQFVAPIIIIIAFSYIYRYRGNLDAVAETDGLFLNQALMRGLADMCLGIFAAQINQWLRKEKMDTVLIRGAGVCGFLFVIVASVKYGISEMDFLFVGILTIATAIAFLPSKSSILNSGWMQKWSNLTFSIYIVHYAFSQYVFSLSLQIPTEFEDKLLYLCVYFVVITIAAVILEMVVKSCQKLLAVIWTKGQKYIRSQ